MPPALSPHAVRSRSRWLVRVVTALFVSAAFVVLVGYGLLAASLPQRDGRRSLAGLGAAVRVERDAQGVPTVRAQTALDAARALGFLHAQERFFQMDLLRRKSSGELAELFGAAALNADRAVRVHRFRWRAEEVWAHLPEEQRAQLRAYTAGVNAGLAALRARPWEYFVLRTSPRPWCEADSLLVVYTMWLDLQDEEGRFERSVNAVRAATGAEASRLAPPGDAHDAAIDGSFFTPPGSIGAKAPREVVAFEAPEPVTGSNAFAIAGVHTAHRAALLASDMHLSMAVPNVWYRALIEISEGKSVRRIVGVTLPGLPDVTVGSNGRVAWGFTNSYIDTVDVVPLELDATHEHYRTPEGWQGFEFFTETIACRGSEPVALRVPWTCWGPVIDQAADGRRWAVKWNAHALDALDLTIRGLSQVNSVSEALALAHRAGMPNQNLIVADADGHIAWTVTGPIPQRTAGFDGLATGDWARGAGWRGWLRADEVPVVFDPAEGLLWSANQRHVGGEALRKLGDNGYDHGFRAGTIRDDLRRLVARGAPIAEGDLLGVQLDDRLAHLLPWRDRFARVLATRADEWSQRVRREVLECDGRAGPESVSYRLVRGFREAAMARVDSALYGAAKKNYPRVNVGKFHREDLVLAALRDEDASAAADQVLADAQRAGLEKFRWGAVNRLEMRHPLSRFLPAFLARRLDMPREELDGDADAPRNQTAKHGASERLIVSPGHEESGVFEMPGGQSGHPLSPYYRAGHDAWVRGLPTPLLPGPARNVLELTPL